MAYFPLLLLGCSKIPDFGVALFFFGCFRGFYPCFQAKVYLTLLGFGFVSASFVGFVAPFFSLFPYSP